MKSSGQPLSGLGRLLERSVEFTSGKFHIGGSDSERWIAHKMVEDNAPGDRCSLVKCINKFISSSLLTQSRSESTSADHREIRKLISVYSVGHLAAQSFLKSALQKVS